MKLAKFYRSRKDFQKTHRRLKLTACPHCQETQTLILHGYLYGYDLKSANKRIVRGRRVFCSDRNRKTGCGKTFSLLKAGRIKRLMIQTRDLWSFLKNIVNGMNVFRAFRSLAAGLSTTSIYRLYRRACLHQPGMRTLLLRRCPAPRDIHHKNPLIKTIIHIKSAFKGRADAIAAFQSTFQTSFL